MDDWLGAAAERIAGAAGLPAGTLGLSEDEVAQLLELARVAAHESGARTNAPLACYLAGLARGANPELTLTELVRAAGGGES